ncbi:MAG: efflux RND transporter permease subunit [Pseudomonadota bacterium]
MDVTRLSVKNPASVAVVVALIVLFGFISINKLPIQLLPVLEQPQISVFNNWREAAPEEMEANIIEPQENVLRNTPGIVAISSNVNRGFGSITLTFDVDTDMSQALINVINNLNQAPPLPVDAGEPFVASGGGFGAATTASMLIYPKADNPNQDIFSDTYTDVIENVVEPRLSQIAGVSQVNMQGSRPKEVIIRFDPYRAAALGIRIGDISNAVSQASDVSGGFADVGRRQYTVRYVGQYDIDKLGELIVAWSNERPIYLNEVADIELELREQAGFTWRNGYPGYYITVQRENDSNTVDILDEVNLAITELNQNHLGELGLILELSFDASVHIRRAISLVQNNLGLGVLLAMGVLWFFIRSGKATLLIALAIPVSLFVSFIALNVFGLSLNVVSLAGLAFSVGLVLDAAIIVQENIFRFRQSGKNTMEAVNGGTRQVISALFASTMTTIAIFLPILFMKGQEGQIFSDLALTLSISVLASFMAAITILPLASSLWLSRIQNTDPCAHWWDNITAFLMKLTNTQTKRVLWVTCLLVGSVTATVVLKPKADFLPSTKSDGIETFFNMPPGITTEVFEKEIAAEIVSRLKPHMDHEKEPYILGYNFSKFGSFALIYLYPQDPEQIDEFITLLREDLLLGLPDTSAFPRQASLLGVGSGGRNIDIDLQGSDIVALMDAARVGMTKISEVLPSAQVRPQPSLSLAEPELQLIPDERRITQAGLTHRDVANSVRAMTGGLFVGEYFDGNDRFDMLLKGGKWTSPEQLAAMPISTPLAGIQTLGELAQIRRTVGPTQLRRIDGQRTISLAVAPPENMSLEETLEILRREVGPTIRAALPADSTINYRGNADDLEAALDDMLKNFLLAILILFMVMAAIFKSLKDSLLVLLIMPLALAGGILALKVMNLIGIYQSLDLLTMIGFIILLGLVVDNAILLVSQTRTGERSGLSTADAVEAAIRVRARPVYMSTLTSIFGMLPLMLVPGVGTDIYRGLAVVIVGGMTISAIFTLVLMPSLLRLREGTPSAEQGITPSHGVLLEEAK